MCRFVRRNAPPYYDEGVTDLPEELPQYMLEDETHADKPRRSFSSSPDRALEAPFPNAPKKLAGIKLLI